MRVTNNMIYSNSLYNMQSSLGALMESNIQGGTQKQINRPSDDPAGTALVLNTRANIAATEQYESNVDTARGWLEMADATLQSTSTTIASIKELARQASTETMSEENRDQIAYQLEQLFGQLLNLSNTEFDGKSLFAGHKYDENAYEQTLGVTSKDADLDTSTMTVSGSSDTSLAVRFLDSGAVGGDPDAVPPVPATDLRYQWSDDGKTWHDATLTAGQTQITMDGVTLDIRPGTTVKAASAVGDVYSTDGSFLYIHPTAEYQGDDNDRSIYAVSTGTAVPGGLSTTVVGTITDNLQFSINADVDLNNPGATINYSITYPDGTAQNYTATVPDPVTQMVELPFEDQDGNRLTMELDVSNATQSTLLAGTNLDLQPRRVDMLNGDAASVNLNAQGSYSHNTLVRLENNDDGSTNIDLAAAGATVNYSYSTDGGNTWIKASSIIPTPAGSTRLALPGGFLELSTPAAGGGVLQAGNQMSIHPDRADLEYEIMEDTYIPVNQVGKDIFGGMYNGQVVDGPNLFEAVGQLITYCQFNDSDGIGEVFEAITAAHEHVETQHTRIGGLTNRLDLADNMLSSEKLDQQERLSYTEDIDLTELLNNLAKQELAYNTVLKSSSMIMQLNLSQFV